MFRVNKIETFVSLIEDEGMQERRMKMEMDAVSLFFSRLIFSSDGRTTDVVRSSVTGHFDWYTPSYSHQIDYGIMCNTRFK